MVEFGRTEKFGLFQGKNPCIFLEGLRKTTKNLRLKIWPLCTELNPGHLECKAGIITYPCWSLMMKRDK
jgi:hypothetical protein